MKYQITRDVVSANGNQIYEVEADSIEDAFAKFSNGDGEFVCEDLEVESLGEMSIHDIWEYEEG